MLPTIDEFKAELKRWARRTTRTVFITIGALFAFMAVAVLIKSLPTRAFGPVVAEFVPAFFFLLAVPLMLYGFWRADQHYKEYPTLQCPQCHNSLANSAGIVIASRNCPHCGAAVLKSLDSSE